MFGAGQLVSLDISIEVDFRRGLKGHRSIRSLAKAQSQDESVYMDGVDFRRIIEPTGRNAASSVVLYNVNK